MTIASPSFGEYKEKGSKFLAYAYFVESEEEVKEKLDLIKKEHFKASHHCYAYRLGLEGDKFRANDDGEPSGTAGKPILGQIDSFGMTNLFIVVVRYYGGTKLGTSGLINAYREAAKEALSLAEPIEKIVETMVDITIKYPDLSDFMHFVKNLDLQIVSSDYGDHDIHFRVSARNSLLVQLNEKIEEWS